MIDISKLNDLQKKDYIALENQCIAMRENGSSYYDIVCMLNDYIYELSETVSENYYISVCKLEQHYHDRYVNRELNKTR